MQINLTRTFLVMALAVFSYPAISEEHDSATLEEVVVTARKKEENIQETCLL